MEKRWMGKRTVGNKEEWKYGMPILMKWRRRKKEKN